MTTLTNPCSLTRFQANLHMIINMESLGWNCRPLSCEMSLVAGVRRDYSIQWITWKDCILTRFFKRKKELINVVAKRETIFSMMRRKVPQLGKKLYSLKTEQFLQYIQPLILGTPETSTRKHAPPCLDTTTKRKYLATNALNKICFSTVFWLKFPLNVWKKNKTKQNKLLKIN